jgi:hypothetical protein
VSRSRENRIRITTDDTTIFVLWFGQVEHLPTSMLWRPNGRGLHSTTFKRSNDPLEYHGFLPYSRCSLCEESPQVGVSHPYNIDLNENHKSKLLGRRRTRFPSLYDFVFSSHRRRPHSQNTSEQAKGADRTETCVVPFALVL